MNVYLKSFLSLIAIVLFLSSPAIAQPGRGGGGFRGNPFDCPKRHERLPQLMIDQ